MNTNQKNKFSIHPAFELLSHHSIDALSLDVLVCQHKQTGAIHYHLAHPSDENAFLIGFRTQPMDSKGEAHILEHTALCGSAKYPVRDPFFSMIKRSLNTFMNAMTAADWTVYPFATQNRKDYFNLLSVYLDATFFPNIDPLDFAQEGIRIELDEADKPQFKGIVFNEMKGAMSGEIDQLYHAIAHHLFPTTTYHYNSGGDPAKIPDLTHEELVHFHQSHYQPTNAVIMSFGNIAVADIQDKLHHDALVRFDKGQKHRSVLEQSFTAPVVATEHYGVNELTKEQTHHVLAWLLPPIINPKERLALRLLEGVLTEHSGSPLRAYLESHSLATAPSPLLGLDDSHYQMVFYAGVRGSEPQHAKAIEQGIMQLLTDMAAKPIDDEEIETILHQIELNQRHIGGDSMPYGLNLMLEAFSTAIHDGNPIDVWQIDEHLAWLREQVKDPTWLPSLLQKHLVDNPHRVRVSLVPDDKQAERLAKEEQQRLDAIDKTLSEADKAHLREQAAALAKRQTTPDDLSLLPKVGLEDVPKSISLAKGSTKSIRLAGQDTTLYQYETGTNGLYYHQIIVPLAGRDDIINHSLLPIYLALLTELGTDSLSARQMQAKQASLSSGITARISQRTSINDPWRLQSYFVMATRALVSKPQAINLLKEVMLEGVFSEHDRIKELLKQKQSAWQSSLSRSGHAYAMQTASRGMSRQAQIEYVRGGLPALNALKAFLTQASTDKTAFDVAFNQLSNGLMALHQSIINLPMQAILVAEADDLPMLTEHLINAWSDTHQTDACQAKKPLNSDAISNLPPAFVQTIPELANGQLVGEVSEKQISEKQVNEKQRVVEDLAWLVATNVYHNASSYPVPPANHADTPALMVLAPYLRHGYLHSAIREQGGAYGGGASYDADACAFKFFSYRDPQCQATFEHFTNSIDWLLTTEQKPEQLEEAILGVVACMDKPGSPAGEAVKSCFADLHERGEAWQNAMRAKILAVTLDDLRRVAKTYLKNQPHTKASLAPYDKAQDLQALGFAVNKITG